VSKAWAVPDQSVAASERAKARVLRVKTALRIVGLVGGLFDRNG
jgi:hypothetical protein